VVFTTLEFSLLAHFLRAALIGGEKAKSEISHTKLVQSTNFVYTTFKKW